MKKVFLSFSILLFISMCLWAQNVPQTIDYQGRLADSDGNYLNEVVTVDFLIFYVETYGTPIWIETQDVSTNNGIFHVLLGSVTPLPTDLFDNDECWLELVVGGETLSPRTIIASVPYAVKAETAYTLQNMGSGSGLDADLLDGQNSSDFMPAATDNWVNTTGDTMTGNLVVNADFRATGITYDSSGDAGTSGQIFSSTVAGTDWINSAATGDITAVTAGTGLTGGGTSGDVTLNADLAGSGAATTISRSDHNHDTNYVNEGQANSVNSNMIVNGTVSVSDLQDGTCLAEILDDDGPGSALNADLLDGQDSSDFVSSTGDTMTGTLTVNPSSGGNGIEGYTTDLDGYGVYGMSTGKYAGYFTSNSTNDDTHVIHAEYTGSGYGSTSAVYGKCIIGSRGVGGWFEGGNTGVLGRVDSEGSNMYYGVKGIVDGGYGNNYGVFGYARGVGQNYGILGNADGDDESYGIYANAYGSGENYGIFAAAWGGTTNWAGYFYGDVKIDGNSQTTGITRDSSGDAGTSGQVLSTTGTGTNWVDATTTYSIGDSYGGGIIFWLDASGQHGLIAATADQSTGIQWYNGTNRYTGTTGNGLYAGEMNTAMIVATQIADNQTGNFAAKVCAHYSVTVGGVTYGDWYLPSKYELNLMYLQKATIGGFISYDYWSSTEYNASRAWLQDFSNGSQGSNYKNYTRKVRAVRAF